jgi:dihydroorotate dehydrogenase
MYRLLRPLLFSLPPEKAHHFTVAMFKTLMRVPGGPALSRLLFSKVDPKLRREAFGLSFPNPVGLAAGFDKDADFFEEFANLGFGFIEVGTITPKPQDGNPQPRMFRLPSDSGLINRMGFNNSGVEVARERLLRRRPGLIIGGNIGKNKVTPNEQAVDDYLICFRRLHDVVDYFVVNVSSPNTPGLRELQDKEPLMHILNTLMAENATVPQPRPILLKIAPDLTDAQLDDIIEIVKETGISGIIATNTTISREGLNTDAATLEEIGMGGLSGQPVKHRSTEVVRYLHTKSNGAFPIIGVGGIGNAADALEKLRAGATLVQVYTGLIYRGPSLIKEINTGILATN